MLTTKQAAEKLGLRPSTVRAWMAARRLGYVKLGRSVRIQEQEIDRLIRQGLVPAREGRDGR